MQVSTFSSVLINRFHCIYTYAYLVSYVYLYIVSYAYLVSYIITTTYHIAMALLASTHLILMSHDYSCQYRPLTSMYRPTRADTFCLDHVISRGLFVITTTYHIAMALLASTHLILMSHDYSCQSVA